MPRETIGRVTEGERYNVKVGWDHMGSVQVGVDETPAVVGETGAWVTLDRHGCNDLIRILRRARDAAFGRNE